MIVCEKALSNQKCIKSKFRNRLQTQHLKSVLWIVLEWYKEGPKNGYEPLLID
jgi:hypothetical protein